MDSSTLAHKLKRLRIELEPEEEAFEIAYKHWGRIIWPLLGLGILAISTIVAFIFVTTAFGANGTTSAIFFMILAILYLTLLLYGFSEWYSYRQSAVVITNQRIIDCQQITFFSRWMQTIDIYEIQSCAGELSPGLGTLFNYGYLYIHTIGDKPSTITYIPIPESICVQVMHYHNLVAHGGSPEAHNSHRQITDETTTNHHNHHIPATETAVLEQELQDDPPPDLSKADENPLVQLAPTLHRVAKRQEQMHWEPAFTPNHYEAVIDPPSSMVKPQRNAVLLMFHIPSEQLHQVLEGLPAKKEPTVTYLERTDYFEIEVIVPKEKIPALVKQLKIKGAEDIICSQIESY